MLLCLLRKGEESTAELHYLLPHLD
jgi:hypothetical protein